MAGRNHNTINTLLHNVHKSEVMAVMHLNKHPGTVLVRLRKPQNDNHSNFEVRHPHCLNQITECKDRHLKSKHNCMLVTTLHRTPRAGSLTTPRWLPLHSTTTLSLPPRHPRRGPPQFEASTYVTQSTDTKPHTPVLSVCYPPHSASHGNILTIPVLPGLT
jgi:hypothetical protein